MADLSVACLVEWKVDLTAEQKVGLLDPLMVVQSVGWRADLMGMMLVVLMVVLMVEGLVASMVEKTAGKMAEKTVESTVGSLVEWKVVLTVEQKVGSLELVMVER